MATLQVIIIIAMLATAAALISGIVSMAQGGEYDQRRSGLLMAARVALQGLTLVLLMVALLLGLK